MSSKEASIGPATSAGASGAGCTCGAASCSVRTCTGWRAEAGRPLSADDAEHEARGGGDAEPSGGDAVSGGLPLEPRVAREGDDARGLVELFEPAHDLRLLGGQPLRREGGVCRVGAGGLHGIQPAAELDGALGAEIAPVDVRRAIARHHRGDECVFREMSTTNHEINEPHG